ncbi:MAG: APC family permease [Terracidiphilus sp.]|jgi:amino acid transporter
MLLVPLVAATYFMVSGGPYGIEDILGGAGYGLAILILLVLPFIWSLPTALMVGELASAIPADGGFYVWVRRAMGPFWGFQEGWLSLAASIFDMAIYPALFVSYLGKLDPALTAGWGHFGWALLVIVVCAAWNLLGAPSVGNGSMVLFVLLLSPFAVLAGLGFWHWHLFHPVVHWTHTHTEGGIAIAIQVAMWNYMGWDNAATVADEVENPQRNYPKAMVLATILVAVGYLIPLGAMAAAGISPASFSTGDWVDVAVVLGGPLLGLAVIAGGALNGLGMFNALVLSYTRVPMAMAEDGMLPKALARCNRHRVPWVSVLLCGAAWAAALSLPFERLISIDLVLYGSSLMLEFVALVVLRIREPKLDRPFKAGNLGFACALGLGPLVLIGYALYAARAEQIGSISALLLAAVVALLGPVFYWLMAAPLSRHRLSSARVTEPVADYSAEI